MLDLDNKIIIPFRRLFTFHFSSSSPSQRASYNLEYGNITLDGLETVTVVLSFSGLLAWLTLWITVTSGTPIMELIKFRACLTGVDFWSSLLSWCSRKAPWERFRGLCCRQEERIQGEGRGQSERASLVEDELDDGYGPPIPQNRKACLVVQYLRGGEHEQYLIVIHINIHLASRTNLCSCFCCASKMVTWRWTGSLVSPNAPVSG